MKANNMIAIPCNDCSRMIEIDTQVTPIKVPCYQILCRDCQIEVKNNERNKKLNKVLRKSLFCRIKETLLSLRSSLQKSVAFFCKILC